MLKSWCCCRATRRPATRARWSATPASSTRERAAHAWAGGRGPRTPRRTIPVTVAHATLPAVHKNASAQRKSHHHIAGEGELGPRVLRLARRTPLPTLPPRTGGGDWTPGRGEGIGITASPRTGGGDGITTSPGWRGFGCDCWVPRVQGFPAGLVACYPDGAGHAMDTRTHLKPRRVARSAPCWLRLRRSSRRRGFRPRPPSRSRRRLRARAPRRPSRWSSARTAGAGAVRPALTADERARSPTCSAAPATTVRGDVRCAIAAVVARRGDGLIVWPPAAGGTQRGEDGGALGSRATTSDALDLAGDELPRQPAARLVALPATITIVVLDACPRAARSRTSRAPSRGRLLVQLGQSADQHRDRGDGVVDPAPSSARSPRRCALRTSPITYSAGLRGAGDANRDGRVTLVEAYR